MPFTNTWAGDCSAWECDELGHLNMSFYVLKFEQARACLIVQMGLTDAFRSDATSSVRAAQFHIKYHSEARPGTPLRIESAITHLGETDAWLSHSMIKGDGSIAATVNERVEHIYLRTYQTFAWPKRARLASEQLMDQRIERARPRNIKLDMHDGHDWDHLRAHDLCSPGGGVFLADEVDTTERVPLSRLFRRTTTTIGWAKDAWPEFADPAYMENGYSGAVLEIHAVMHRYPRQGDAYIYVPALLSANTHTRQILHNMIDPVSGQSWLTMEAAGCKFDLNTRKLIKNSPEDIEQLMAEAKPDLAL